MSNPDRRLGSIGFAPLRRADFPLVTGWLAAPHVRRWWPGDGGPATTEREFAAMVDGDDPAMAFLVRLDDRPIGVTQCYLHADDPDWDRVVGIPDAAGLDYLIGDPADTGRGVGTAVITAFGLLMFELYPRVRTLVSVPQADNPASCRALEKAGYRLVARRMLDTDDPADSGLAAVYSLPRPG